MAEGAISVEGLVVEALPNGTYKVELVNGHQLVGYVALRDKPQFAGMAAGWRVRLRMSPCDLSKGRIVGKA